MLCQQQLPRRWSGVLIVGFLVLTVLAATSRVSAQAFTIGANFTDGSYGDEGYGFIPPDTMGAVGPNHVGVLINGHFSVFNKTGTPQLSKSLDQFWIDAGVTPAGSFSFDPRILYDPDNQRWFAASVDNGRGANNFLVGVSASSDPTGTWTGFQIDADSDDTHWADFPMMGMNQDVVVVQANMFPIGTGTSDKSTLVLPKSGLLAVTPTVAGATLLEETSSTSNPGFSAQPIVDMDNGALPLPILAAWNKPAGWLKASDIGGTAAAPTLNTTGGFISVTSRGSPPDIDQPGSKQDIDAGDNRFSGNVVMQKHSWRPNSSLWAVHGVEIAGRAAIEWYEIDANTDAVLQSGIVDDASLAFNYPSIAVNDDGDVVIGFSGGDPNTFMSTYVAVGETTGGVTTFSLATLTQAGAADYERLDGADPPRNRWGDYSATVVDPNDPLHFWTFQEWASDTNVWSVQVTEIIVPEPATIGLLTLGGVALIGRRRRR